MEKEINIRNEDDTVSNSEEESSSSQVPRSGVKEENLFSNKVRDMMNTGYCFGNDKIVDESIDTIHNNNVRNSDIDEQNVTSNSEDDDTSDSQDKNDDHDNEDDDFSSSIRYNHTKKKKEFERGQRDKIIRHSKNHSSVDSTDEENNNPISKSNDNDDDTSDSQVKNDDHDDDDIPSSSGRNRIDKKKEFGSYYREQKDEFTRRPKNQDSDDYSTDGNPKKQNSTSRYVVKNRKNLDMSDDDNGNDDNDYDDNIGDIKVENDDYYKDVISSSSGRNRIDKKKEFGSYYREQKDEFTRRPKNQDSDDYSTDENPKKQNSTSRYVVKNRKKFDMSDDDNGNDDNDHDDNVSDNQVKNDDYYEDDIPSSSGHNRIDKKKEFGPYLRCTVWIKSMECQAGQKFNVES